MKFIFSLLRATPFVGTSVVRRPVYLTFNLLRFVLTKLKMNEIGLQRAGLDLDDRDLELCPLTRRELLDLYEDIADQTDWKGVHFSPASDVTPYQIRETDLYNLQKFRYFLENQLATLARQYPDDHPSGQQIVELYEQLTEFRLSLNNWL